MSKIHDIKDREKKLPLDKHAERAAKRAFKKYFIDRKADNEGSDITAGKTDKNGNADLSDEGENDERE